MDRLKHAFIEDSLLHPTSTIASPLPSSLPPTAAQKLQYTTRSGRTVNVSKPLIFLMGDSPPRGRGGV